MIKRRFHVRKNPRRASQRVGLIAVLVIVGAIGVTLLVHSHAATPTFSYEPENGLRTGDITAGDSNGASGGASIKFGSASGTILFQDDFNGPAGASFDKSKWYQYSACGYRGSAAYGNIQCGEDETLDGTGHLIIPATPTRGQSLMTGDDFKFTYGTMSAWIKIPSQTGYWPAFWTVNDYTKGTPAASLVGEIDALEGYTTWNDVYHATGHNWTGDSTTTSSAGDHRCAEGQGINLSTSFNKYTAKVEPGKITFYFNDVQCGAVFTKEQNPGKPWNFGPDITRGNWLILTLAVGGAGGQQIPATQNAQMLVDRVEVRSN